MRLPLFSLFLTAVHVVDCGPRLLRDPEQMSEHHHQQVKFHPKTHGASTAAFYSEKRGSVTKVHSDFLIVLPVKTSNFVSIFDLRRKRFLCIDLKGDLYISRHKDKDECLFQRLFVHLPNQHHHVFYVTSRGKLLKLERAAHQYPDHFSSSSALLQNFLDPLAKRKRRSEVVNPSDPLGTQSLPSQPAVDHIDTVPEVQPDQDQTGAVSKETIDSCNDPLKVLHTEGAVRPAKTNGDQGEQ